MKRAIHRSLLFFLICLSIVVPPAAAWEREELSAFHERRARLVRESGGDGIVILFGYREQDIGVATTPFRQNENFYYLTGWNEPDAMMMLVPKAGKTAGGEAEIEKEILFIPPHDHVQEKWTGPKLGPDDAEASAKTGFPIVRTNTLFQSELDDALKGFSKIYTEMTPQPEAGEECFIHDMHGRIKKLAPLASLHDFRGILTRLRTIKSPGEIALIRKAVDASVEAHLAALKATKPGAWEYEVAARMMYEFQRLGCEWPAYPPIVGSGFYSTVLHYGQNSKQMAAGEVVVMDVGGAYSGYASDITRTLPVSGKFSARQREIYEIVLAAADAAIAAARPGVLLGRRGDKGLQKIAYDYINSHGRDKNGQRLGQYFIHGLGHHVGLNVHDPADYTQPLEAGMVITIEPGIYIPGEKLGVRIEDMLLITKDGCEVLSRRLPRTVDAIERAMGEQ